MSHLHFEFPLVTDIILSSCLMEAFHPPKYKNSPSADPEVEQDRGHISNFLSPVFFFAQPDDIEQPWFHQNESRSSTEELLKGSNSVGSFLVRPSSRSGLYAVSWLSEDNNVSHKLIFKNNHGYTLDNSSTAFATLAELVEFYPYLAFPINVSDYTSSAEAVRQTSEGLLWRLVEHLRYNNPECTSLSWVFGLSSCRGNGIGWNSFVNSSTEGEVRTLISFGREKHSSPAIVPLYYWNYTVREPGMDFPEEDDHEVAEKKDVDLKEERRTLIEVFPEKKFITSISLPKFDYYYLFEAMSINQYLHTVCLQGYLGAMGTVAEATITDQECVLLSRALFSNCTITDIDISYNVVSDEGAAALAEAIQVQKPYSPLVSLNVSNNVIEVRGIAALATCIESAISMTTLKAGNQRIYNKWSRQLRLSTNKHLISLIRNINQALQLRKDMYFAPNKDFHGFLSSKKAESYLSNTELYKNSTRSQGVSIDSTRDSKTPFSRLSPPIISQTSTSSVLPSPHSFLPDRGAFLYYTNPCRPHTLSICYTDKSTGDSSSSISHKVLYPTTTGFSESPSSFKLPSLLETAAWRFSSLLHDPDYLNNIISTKFNTSKTPLDSISSLTPQQFSKFLEKKLSALLLSDELLKLVLIQERFAPLCKVRFLKRSQ